MIPETNIVPDRWVLLHLEVDGKKEKRILASFYGGYSGADNWRLSTPIKLPYTKVMDADVIICTTESGSTYICHKNAQGMHLTSAGIYESMKKELGDKLEIEEWEDV